MSRSPSNKKNTDWVPMRMCECCGRDIVLLKLPTFGSKTDPRWYRACYLKGWDRNPWFVFGCAHPHPAKRYAKFKAEEAGEQEPVDPFFAL